MNIPVFDLHCDTGFALLGQNLKYRKNLRENDCHIDLKRASALPGYVQCFACYTDPGMQERFGKSPISIFEMELAALLSEMEKNSDLIRLAYNPEEIDENIKNNKMSGILTIEGPAGFGYDPALLEDLYKIGFRMTTLGWNEGNVLAGSHITGEGLTEIGREYVKEAQRLGMLVDVSHISDKAFWDIMEISRGPVIASHSNSRTVWNASRNLTDDMFLAICQSGGVVGINLYADFLGANPTLNTAVDHIMHFLHLDSSGNHIALGCDLDGCDKLPSDFSGVQDYPAFAQALFDREISDEIIKKIFWKNALGVFQNALCVDKK